MTAECKVARSMAQLASVLVLVGLPALGLANAQCGTPHDTGGVGPFDFQDIGQRRMLAVVEKYHFQPDITKAALRGEYRSDDSGDLDYTLRAYPNHPNALYIMGVHQIHAKRQLKAEFGLRFGEGGEYRSAECYFERAKMLSPNDPVVYSMHGLYLQYKGDLKGALKKFERAASIAPESAKAQYNLGLINYALKRYDAALEHAKLAYGRGYRKPQLKQRLKALGKWQD